MFAAATATAAVTLLRYGTQEIQRKARRACYLPHQHKEQGRVMGEFSFLVLNAGQSHIFPPGFLQ
jgi:hypothetical protein